MILFRLLADAVVMLCGGIKILVFLMRGGNGEGEERDDY